MVINKQDIKILIVDDQPSNLRFLSKILTQKGYKVQRAICGEMVLNAEFASQPDLILLDIVMPKMNGYEVCKRLKNHEKTGDIPVIFLSILKEPLDKIKAFEVGGVDYISKPFQVEEVLARIEKQLKIQQLSKQLKEQNSQLQQEIEVRKQAQETLLKTQKRLDYLLSSNPSIIYSCQPTYPYANTFISKNITHLFGYEPREFIEDPGFWGKHIHPDDRERIFAEIPQLFERGDYSYEFRFLRKNSTYLWVYSACKLVRDEQGNPIEIIGSWSDITQRKQIEEALQESQHWLQSITDANPNILYVYDLIEQRNIYVNREIYTILGYTPEEIQNMGTAVLQTLIHPDDFALLPQSFKKIYTAKDGEIIEFDYRMQHKNGEWRWLFSREVVFTRTSNGKPKQILGAAADITERKQAKIALQQALAAAQAANRAKTTFLASMSHELRTPLNAVIGFSQILARDESLATQQKKYIEIINRSGGHLLELINDVLSMSKIEAGQITLNEDRFDLYAVLNSLQEMLQLKAKTKNLQLNFEHTFDVPQYVQTDENKLRQVLINLLGNAIKFTQQGNVTLRVSLVKRDWSGVKNKGQRTKDKGQTTITFEISDTGPGISSEELNTIFDPFVQSQTGRKSIEGTGLGLPISREFVQLMGGDITVRSTPGEGSTFTFDIKVDLASQADVLPSVPDGVVIGLEPNQPSYRILIAEDVEESRLLLVKLLERLGFEIKEAVNGQEAFAIWKQWQPHLILMDICMPIMDGYEAIKAIRKDEKLRIKDEKSSGSQFQVQTKEYQANNLVHPTYTITIALTASAFEEQRDAILKSGCDDFIAKPFPEKILYKKIAHHLGVRYLYEAENQFQEVDQQLSLTIDDFSIMPIEWQKKLHWAALTMDDDLILELIKQIPESHATLANTIINLIDNFRIEVIIDCFKEV
ncbi:MAG: response regulator [Potamolinea sp.]